MPGSVTATCENDGVKAYECTDCHETMYSTAIPASSHTSADFVKSDIDYTVEHISTTGTVNGSVFNDTEYYYEFINIGYSRKEEFKITMSEAGTIYLPIYFTSSSVGIGIVDLHSG